MNALESPPSPPRAPSATAERHRRAVRDRNGIFADWIAATYLFLFDGWRRFLVLGHGVFVGVFLGLLGRRALHAIDERDYRRQRMYRSSAYNRRGLFTWEQEVLESHFPARGRLSVVGAGGGREVLALSMMSYEVAGFECNRALVETASRVLREAGSEASVTWLPRDAAPRDRGRYDGSIVGWGAYTLMMGRERRIGFLRGLAESLRPGAPVLISFYTWDGRGRYGRCVHLLANMIRRVLRREPVELGDDLTPNFVHRFTEAEVERELREAGFKPRRFQGQPPGPHANGFAVGVRS